MNLITPRRLHVHNYLEKYFECASTIGRKEDYLECASTIGRKEDYLECASTTGRQEKYFKCASTIEMTCPCHSTQRRKIR